MIDTPARASEAMPSLILFSYFQLLDLLTTIGFLLHGVKEGNPLVRLALMTAPSPMAGLIIVKIVAIGIGIYCWKLGKQQLLGRINVLFGALISWNLWALILASV